MNVADLIGKPVVPVMSGHSIWHAVDGDGGLRGIFTEGDLLRRVEFGPTDGRHAWMEATSPDGAARDFVRSHSWKVSDPMTSTVATVQETTSIADVAALFSARGIKRAPVLRNGEVVSIISRADLLRMIAAGAPDKIAEGDVWISAEARLKDADAIFAKRPDVTVANGVVHIWGIVGFEAERDAAGVAVEGVQGIRSVENHLTVRKPAT